MTKQMIDPKDFSSIIAGIGHACSIKQFEKIMQDDPECVGRAAEARYVRKLNDITTKNTPANYVR